MSIPEAWKADPEMENRDPTPLNPHVKVEWEDLVGEPEHTRSIDCVWKYSYKCFNLWKALCYIIVTTLCGIPHAICYGCCFACIAFCHIWEVTPCLALLEINLGAYKRFATLCIGACVEPLCTACSACFIHCKKG